MTEQLIERVFMARNSAHVAHWREGSGYRHETLGSFYTDCISALDQVVEYSQAAFDLVKMTSTCKCSYPEDMDILKILEEDVVWINRNRKAISGGVLAIDNVLQELEGVYLTAIYKLKRLK